MSDIPTPEETALWQKRLASQANNRAWALSESSTRTPADDQEMLHAAHAAMHLWAIMGNERSKAHAEQLLAHVHALLGHAAAAGRYGQPAFAFFTREDNAPWEMAFAHAIAANVASCQGDTATHAARYAEGQTRIAALEDPEDREILERTLRVIPAPSA